MANNTRILTETHAKTMIRVSELGRVLNKTELEQFNNIINKIKIFEEKERGRLDG